MPPQWRLSGEFAYNLRAFQWCMKVGAYDVANGIFKKMQKTDKRIIVYHRNGEKHFGRT